MSNGPRVVRSSWACWPGFRPPLLIRLAHAALRRGNRRSQYVPDLLRRYIGDVVIGSMKSDGLQQRLQIAVWPDWDSTVAYVDRPPDPKLYECVEQLFRAFSHPDYDAESPRTLKFDREGQRLFEEWWIRLESKNRQSDEPAFLKSYYTKYKSLLPSIALQLQLAATPYATEVSAKCAQDAIAWCRWLAEHAKRIYLCTTSSSGGTVTLANHIRAGDLPVPFTTRQVVRNHWGNLSTYEEVNAALAELSDLGWIRHQDRRVWHVNPKIHNL